MPKFVTDKEISTAVKLCSRKKGATRQDVADRLKVGPNRAHTVLSHAQKQGDWAVDLRGGKGKDNRTKIYKCVKAAAK